MLKGVHYRRNLGGGITATVMSDISVGKTTDYLSFSHDKDANVVELIIAFEKTAIDVIIPVLDFEYLKAAVDKISETLKEEKQVQEQVQVQEQEKIKGTSQK
jgi:hypothetical protein